MEGMDRFDVAATGPQGGGGLPHLAWGAAPLGSGEHAAEPEEGQGQLHQGGQGGDGAGQHQFVRFAVFGVVRNLFGAIVDHCNPLPAELLHQAFADRCARRLGPFGFVSSQRGLSGLRDRGLQAGSRELHQGDE